MALSKDVVIRLLGDASSAKAAIQAAADEADVSVAAYKRAEREYQKQQQAEATSAQNRQQALKDTGAAATTMGAVMLAGFGVAVMAAADFDRSMSAVHAATQANAGDMEALRAAALQAGADTMYSATEAADAETELAKAGLSTADIVGGALAGSLNLAAAGQIAVADAAGITATALTQFHLAGSDATHVSDLLAAGAGKAMGGVGDLSEALKYVGPVAAGMNVSIDQTVGVLAEFASQGILGSQAGTSLRGVISALTSPSSQAAAEMQQLGINVFDAQGKFIGLDGVAGQLQQSMGGLTQAERQNALGRIFGNEQLVAAQVLYQGGAQAVQDWTGKVNDQGYAARIAAQQTDNLAGDVERLGGSLSTVLIKGGSGANDVLRFMAQAFTGVVNAAGDLPGPLSAALFGVLGIAGAGTTLLGVIGSVIPRVREARQTLADIGPVGEKINGVLGTVGSALSKAAIGIGIFAALDATMSALDPDLKVTQADTNELATALERLGKTGDTSGELSKMLGSARNGVDDLVASMRVEQPVSDQFESVWTSVPKWMRDAATGAGLASDAIDRQRLSFQQSTQNVQDVDKALAQLVSNGHAEEAAAAAQRLVDAWTASGGSVNEFRDKFPQLFSALDTYKAQATTTVGQTGAITDGLDKAVSAADELKGAFDSLNGTALSSAEMNVKWTEALTGIKVAADNGSKSLDLNTKAGADNAQQFIDAAKSASDYAQTVANTQGIDAGRAALQKMRDDLYNAAVNAGFNKDAVRQMIDMIFQVPKDTPTAVTLHDNATPGLNAVDGFLNRLDGKTAHTEVDNTIVTTYLNRVLNATPAGPNAYSAPSGLVGLPPVRAAGGPVWPGTFLVGEHGPELVQMGGHGFVTPADMTRQVLGGRPLTTAGTPLNTPAGMSIDLDALAAAITRSLPTGAGGFHVENFHQAAEGASAYETAEALAFLARGR